MNLQPAAVYTSRVTRLIILIHIIYILSNILINTTYNNMKYAVLAMSFIIAIFC